MNKILFALFMLVIALFSNSCKEHIVDSDVVSTSAYKYLPLNVGNYWVYKSINIDPGRKYRQDFKIEIKKKLFHEDGSLIYGYTYHVLGTIIRPGELMLGYYSPQKNDIYYYSDETEIYAGVPCYKFPIIRSPLLPGNRWIAYGDTYIIAGYQSIEVNEVKYPESILIVRRDNYGLDSTWYVKNIGLVKEVSLGNDGYCFMNELESYYVK